MVNQSAEAFVLAPDPIELPEEELRWCSVSLREVIQRESRLKAAVFDIEGRHARELLEECRWPAKKMAGSQGLASASYPNRFKRHWVEYSDYPILQPGQITEIDPRPAGYLSPLTKTDIEDLRAKYGQILMTRSGRSGSIGRTTYVSRTLDGRIISDDVIRIECSEPDTAGYLYAFLNTKTGRALVKSNEYGAMIPHIEPSHLETVPLPNPPPILKKQIHDLVIHSYALRDESNALLEEAERILCDALKLPALAKLRPRAFAKEAGVSNYTVTLSRLRGRLDASYHDPTVDAIMASISKEASEITTIGDPRISKRVVLPGRFARVYVEEGQGVPFFGGKQIHQLDPTDRKFLSLKIHGPRIREQLALEENMVLITCSGTIGKVAFAPKHWKGFAASQHIIRVLPAAPEVAGYLYVFLATGYGRKLITRFSYGSAVGEIDAHHVSQVPIPLLKTELAQAEINRLALEANAKRTQAYHEEQKAIRLTNEEVIHNKAEPT
ncbi:restriction endonuclease subunit S [Anaerobaca lacustris]|uniref:Restriction endonuclease subunit S n=1 Tax=Anaerobaca lacustris TaxID=3044600 RepID=A0AAW6TTC4_9BACT|nr:restriction endonuclease subunit S [Sedimentisphaerales bacterium M17dextr]